MQGMKKNKPSKLSSVLHWTPNKQCLVCKLGKYWDKDFHTKSSLLLANEAKDIICLKSLKYNAIKSWQIYFSGSALLIKIVFWPPGDVLEDIMTKANRRLPKVLNTRMQEKATTDEVLNKKLQIHYHHYWHYIGNDM